MGLSPTDSLPYGISIADAYSAIRTWYQANISEAEARGDDYGNSSAKLIRFLPPASEMSELEQTAVLLEVICGYLEWGYHKSDSQYKLAAYAQAALETHRVSDAFLTPAEQNTLSKSKLYSYLYLKQQTSLG